ncbi:MAG TPA: M90 family metallopeptidase [Phycisphaerae bacterium]|nr:M90 family metallopeptidase [Phycisphaerae bacterium]
MIPTPERLRTNRRWSAALASGLATAGGAVAWLALPDWTGRLAAWAVCAAAGWGAYRFGTRVLRRRMKVLARPFPAAWQEVLEARVAYYAALGDEEKDRFRRLVAVFLDETPITAAGCEVDDTCRVLVAASAVIPIFGFPAWEYATLREVVVRGEQFDFRFPGRDEVTPDILGLVGNTGGAFHGTMVLSRRDLLRGFAARPGKHNVGIHEFAHLIDQADGSIDGVPASLPRECLRPWLHLVRAELQRGWEGWSDIPEYAFTDEEEFFAVAAEYFFQAPEELAANHPELYELLQRVFRQNTRARLRGLVRRRKRPSRAS